MLVALVVALSRRRSPTRIARPGPTRGSTRSIATLGGGNSVLPAQAIGVEARGLDPRGRDVHRGGRRAAAELERARHPRHARELHAVLPPASPDESRRGLDPLLRVRPERVPGRDAGLGGRGGRARDPETAHVTVRALAGLVGAEPRVRPRRALAPLGRSAASARGAPSCGSPGSATCSASPRSESSGRRSSSSGVPFGGIEVVGVARRSSVWPASPPGCSAASAVPHGLGRGPWPRRSLLVTAAGIALAGLFLEALFRAARLQSLQAYDAWAFWVPKGKAIYFFEGLDEHVFTTTPNADVPAPAADPRRRGVPRDGRRGRGHAARAVLVPRRRRRRRGRRAAPSPRTRVAPLAVPPARPRRAALRRAAAGAAGGRARGRLRRRRGPAARAVAPRPGRLAPRGGRGAARRCGEHEARGHPVRGCRARRRVRPSPGRERWPRLGSRGARRRAGDRSRGASGRRATTSPSGAPTVVRRRPTRRRAPASRSRFSTRTSRWSVVPLVATIALVAAARLGRSSPRRLRRARLGLLLFAGGVWSTVGFEELAITADESGNPIVRYTGSIVLLAAVADAAPARARSGDGAERAVSSAPPPPRGGGDRRRPARRRTRSSSRRTARRFPSVDDCVRRGSCRVDRAARPRLRTAGHAARRPTSCSSASAAWATSTRSSSRTAAAAGRCSTTGSSRYEQGLESRAEARGAGLEAELELEPPG